MINPSRKQRSQSHLNLVVTGNKNKNTIMLEADANNLEKGLFVEGIKAGLESCAIIAQGIEEVS